MLYGGALNNIKLINNLYYLHSKAPILFNCILLKTNLGKIISLANNNFKLKLNNKDNFNI